jgi:GntR family uxuAB operon transcriptional repressor
MSENIIMASRTYKKVAELIKKEMLADVYKIGERLPAEREFADRLGVSRTVIREALIMLELSNLVSVKKGSGVYVVNLPVEESVEKDTTFSDVGPFELLQARQLLESGIAEFAAIQANRNDIVKLREILNRERLLLEQGEENYIADEDFHCTIAEITQNEVLIKMQKDLWTYRSDSRMWKGLHARISEQSYRYLWLSDHENIFDRNSA